MNNNEIPVGRWLPKLRVPAPLWAWLPDDWIPADCGSSACAAENRPPRRPAARNPPHSIRPTSTSKPTLPASTRWCSLSGRPVAALRRRRDAAPRWWCDRRRLLLRAVPPTSAHIESDQQQKKNQTKSLIIDLHVYRGLLRVRKIAIGRPAFEPLQTPPTVGLFLEHFFFFSQFRSNLQQF